jgi:transposase
LCGLFGAAVTQRDRDRGSVAAWNAGYSLREVAAFLEVHYSTVSKMVMRATGDGRRCQSSKELAIQDLTP